MRNSRDHVPWQTSLHASRLFLLGHNVTIVATPLPTPPPPPPHHGDDGLPLYGAIIIIVGSVVCCVSFINIAYWVRGRKKTRNSEAVGRCSELQDPSDSESETPYAQLDER